MMKLFRYPIILCLAMLAGCNDSNENNVVERGAPLAFGLHSYMSVEEVKRALLLESEDIIVVNRHTEASASWSPSSMIDFLYVEIQHTDIKGSLYLNFYNDRLWYVLFVPEDSYRFTQIAELYKSKGIHNELDGIIIRPFVKIIFRYTPTGMRDHVNDEGPPYNYKFDNRPYIIWADIRLHKERDEMVAASLS